MHWILPFLVYIVYVRFLFFFCLKRFRPVAETAKRESHGFGHKKPINRLLFHFFLYLFIMAYFYAIIVGYITAIERRKA